MTRIMGWCLVLVLASGHLGASEGKKPKSNQERCARWIHLLGSQLPGERVVALRNLQSLSQLWPETSQHLVDELGKLRDLNTLKDAWDGSLRRRAWLVMALGLAPSESSSRELMSVAESPKEHPSIRGLALMGLAKHRPDAALRNRLEALASGEGVKVIESLERNAWSPALSVEYVRRVACLTIGQLGFKESTKVLETVAKATDTTTSLRMAALVAMGNLEGVPGDISGAMIGLHREWRKLRRADDRQPLESLLHAQIISIGARVPTRNEKMVLLELASRDEIPSHLRNSAVVVLSRHGEDPGFKDMMGHKDPLVRTAAALGTTRFFESDPVATETLCTVAREGPGTEARAYASLTLGAFRRPEVVRLLKELALKDSSESIRLTSVGALGHLDYPPAAEALFAVVQDPSTPEFVASECLGYLAERPQVPVGLEKPIRGLIRKTQESYTWIKCLRFMGSHATEGQHDIIRLGLAHPHPDVKIEALVSAVKLGKAFADDMGCLMDDGMETVREAATEATASIKAGKPTHWMTQQIENRTKHTGGSLEEEWDRIRLGLFTQCLALRVVDAQDTPLDRAIALGNSTAQPGGFRIVESSITKSEMLRKQEKFLSLTEKDVADIERIEYYST